MNELEAELWAKRLKNPIENWDKIVEATKSLRAAIRTGGYGGFRPDLALALDLGTVIANLYEEVWRKPEKIVFFRDDAIDMNDLLPKRKFGRSVGNIDLLKNNSTVITTDSILSYIALREHGFRIKVYGIAWWRYFRWWDAINVLAITKIVLKPSVLFPILESDLSRAKKAKKFNRMLRNYDPVLDNLILMVGRKEEKENECTGSRAVDQKT